MVPLAYTIVRRTSSHYGNKYLQLEKGVKYNIKNAALLGACAIPSGIGEMGKKILAEN